MQRPSQPPLDRHRTSRFIRIDHEAPYKTKKETSLNIPLRSFSHTEVLPSCRSDIRIASSSRNWGNAHHEQEFWPFCPFCPGKMAYNRVVRRQKKSLCRRLSLHCTRHLCLVHLCTSSGYRPKHWCPFFSTYLKGCEKRKLVVPAQDTLRIPHEQHRQDATVLEQIH